MTFESGIAFAVSWPQAVSTGNYSGTLPPSALTSWLAHTPFQSVETEDSKLQWPRVELKNHRKYLLSGETCLNDESENTQAERRLLSSNSMFSFYSRISRVISLDRISGIRLVIIVSLYVWLISSSISWLLPFSNYVFIPRSGRNLWFSCALWIFTLLMLTACHISV